MAIFGFGKDKKDPANASEQVLAYLEEAQRARTPFTLTGPRKTEATAAIQSIDESQGLVSFQVAGPWTVEKGARLQLTFIVDGVRVGGTCTVAEARANLVTAGLPEALELRERRGQPRARLNPKEGTTLTALTGLFEGVGINGNVENLSEGGARIRVEKAMSLKGEKRLPLGTGLVPAGQPFMLIKLNKAPKCVAVMELEGRAVFLDTGGGGLAMGIAFDKLRPDHASALRSLVASRTTAIPSALPQKARRRQEAPAPEPARPVPAQQEAAAVPAQQEASGAPGVPPSAGLAPRAPSAPQAAATAGPEAAPALVAAPRNEALLRLKKRARTVVALAPSPGFGDLLRDHLQEEGYGKVLVTASSKELMDFLQQPNLAVLLIDGDFSTLDALQFVTRLKAGQANLPPIILAGQEVSTSIVLAAHRAGVSQMLVKPYALDAALTDLLNQQMGL
jgi:CheY-like chemotaxis protein